MLHDTGGVGHATPWGAIMNIDEIIRIAKTPLKADKSALGAINRPLRMSGLIC